MSENGFRKRNFLQKLSDRIVFKLTGKKPGPGRQHSPHKKQIFVNADENLPIAERQTKSAGKGKKSGPQGFFKKLYNPRSNRRGNYTSGKVNLNIPVNRPIQGTPGQGNSPESSPALKDLSRPPMPVRAGKQPGRNKKSLYVKLFGSGKRKQEQRRVLVESKPEDKKAIRKALVIESFAFLNSLGFYILAYLSVYLIYQFTEALAAANFDIDSVLFYYEIYFPIGNSSPLWNKFNIIAITLASPLISLILSLILLRAVLVREKLKPQLRLFLLWVAFHGATYFLGAFVAGIATSQGFGYVVDWMYVNVFFRIFISLVFLFLLTVTGYKSAVFALETIPPGIRQQRWRLSLSLGLRFILPWIVGGMMIIAIKFPNAAPQHPNIMVYDAIVIATMGFMVIPVFFNYKAKPRSVAERPLQFKRPPGILIFITSIVVLVLFRLVFERGIHLIINFSFDVGFYR
ncbi:MAG: hypothetical protein IPH20_17560 [Bacteroidales bacterium]|nr:hypothetical protein [Bacteroidales bacterium]